MDKLKLLRGEPLVLGGLTVSHPTLEQIYQFGEENYWSTVSQLVATPFDYKVALDDAGLDYEKVEAFDLFIDIRSNFPKEATNIFFGDIDMSELYLVEGQTGLALCNDGMGVYIDKPVYECITEYIRDINGIEKFKYRPGNAATKRQYIEDDRRALRRHKKKIFKSMLSPLVSSMVNCAGFKYDYTSVWGLHIYTFMDSVKRIQRIQNYNNLMTGIYTGNIEFKHVKSELNWLEEL